MTEGYPQYAEWLKSPSLEKWSADQKAVRLSRTNVQYACMPLSELKDRGIKNDMLDRLMSLPSGVFVAGGFAASVLEPEHKAKDIDLFFASEEAFLKTYQQLKEGKAPLAGYETKVLIGSENTEEVAKMSYVGFKHADSHIMPIQLIKTAWYESAEALIDTFDFTVTQVGIDVGAQKMFFNPVTTIDLSKKRLALHRMQFPISTMRRMLKYTGKGYTACNGFLTSMATKIHETFDPGTEQVLYID